MKRKRKRQFVFSSENFEFDCIDANLLLKNVEIEATDVFPV